MSASTPGATPHYYVPADSRHPIMAAGGLFFVIALARFRTFLAAQQ